MSADIAECPLGTKLPAVETTPTTPRPRRTTCGSRQPLPGVDEMTQGRAGQEDLGAGNDRPPAEDTEGAVQETQNRSPVEGFQSRMWPGRPVLLGKRSGASGFGNMQGVTLGCFGGAVGQTPEQPGLKRRRCRADSSSQGSPWRTDLGPGGGQPWGRMFSVRADPWGKGKSPKAGRKGRRGRAQAGLSQEGRVRQDAGAGSAAQPARGWRTPRRAEEPGSPR